MFVLSAVLSSLLMQLSFYLLAPLVMMSLAVFESESASRSSEEVGFIPEMQAQTTKAHHSPRNELDAPRPCHSSHITHKRLAGWPVHRIMEELYIRNIKVPADLTHEELFNFLLIQENFTKALEQGAGEAGCW